VKTEKNREDFILKGMAKWPDKVINIARESQLEVGDFVTSNGHKFLYQAILSAYLDGLIINEENIRKILKGEKWRGKSKLEWCKKIIDEVFDDYSDILDEGEGDFRSAINSMIDESLRRESVDILRDTMAKIKSKKGEVIKLVRQHIERLSTLIEKKRGYEYGFVDEDLDYLKGMSLRGEKELLGLDSGFPLLNEKLNGFENELYAIGGGTGMGKTTFITQLVFQILRMNNDVKVIFFALDQSRKDILVKFISEASSLPVDYIRNPNRENRLFYMVID